METTISWLRDNDPGRVAAAPHRSDTGNSKLVRDAVALQSHGTTIVERPTALEFAGGRQFGMISEPAHGEREPLCAVLLNGGALRRIGPNRTWVELARRWSARGIPTVRIDFEGIGDSDGDERKHV